MKLSTQLISSLSLCAAALTLSTLSGCQGQPSENPPIHPNLNMDFQTKYRPQKENKFFEDGRAMRLPVAGTVAQGQLKEDSALHLGKSGEAFVTKIPVGISLPLVERGQERYNIYCAVCHGKTGQGNGIVIQRNAGMLKPPSIHEERLVNMPAGQVYDAIKNGVRGNMPSYAYAIPVEDRWAIVAYIQALQLSQRGTIDNVPSDLATSKGWKR
ncbi:MAG: cytochrome c [Betaproteobacteria bacterium]|nr:cytochrome c [Betaproteobacteria bacterium]